MLSTQVSSLIFQPTQLSFFCPAPTCTRLCSQCHVGLRMTNPWPTKKPSQKSVKQYFSCYLKGTLFIKKGVPTEWHHTAHTLCFLYTDARTERFLMPLQHATAAWRYLLPLQQISWEIHAAKWSYKVGRKEDTSQRKQSSTLSFTPNNFLLNLDWDCDLLNLYKNTEL